MGKTILMRRLVAAAAVAAAAACGTAAASVAMEPSSHVLVFQSYDTGYRWTNEITRGIEDNLRRRDGTISVHFEYMDTKLVPPDEGYFLGLLDLYRRKYGKNRFDVVVAADNDAFDFLVRYRDELFPGTPVVFCGINYYHPSMLRGKTGFTGVTESPDIEKTLDLALRMHPGTKQIAVITDSSTTGRAIRENVLELVPAYRQVEIVFLSDMEMPDILARTEALRKGAVVFYTFFSRDHADRFYEYDQSISLLAEHCSVPIYGGWDFNLGHGIVGGKLISGYNQGADAARKVLRILNGEKADEIPVETKSPNRYMFDYRQLKRFGLDYSPLPEGSVVINRPAPYAVPRKVFWSILGLSGAILSGIGILALRNRRGHMKAEQLLRETCSLVAEGFDEAPVGLAIGGPDGRWLRVNRRLCLILRATAAELLYRQPEELTHPADVADAAVYRNRLLGGDILRYALRTRLVRRDGEPVPVLLTSSAVRSPNGDLKSTVTVVEDGTAEAPGKVLLGLPTPQPASRTAPGTPSRSP